MPTSSDVTLAARRKRQIALVDTGQQKGVALVLYFWAIVLPPIAVLLCGRPFQALLSIPLTLLFWFPGILHALFVVNNHYADKRNKQLIDELHRRP